MFESFEDSLGMCELYAVVGFFLGVLYNVFRFVRLAFPKLKIIAAVLDILFAVISAFVLFAYSVEYGTGFFRLYYVLAAAVGFAVNMLTLGFAVPPVSRLFGRIFRAAAGRIGALLGKLFGAIHQTAGRCFVKISEKSTIFREKCRNVLKTRRNMVYNNEDNRIGKVYRKGSEKKNGIKAKVRKIV